MFCEIPLVPSTVPAASPVDCLDTTELSRSAFEPLSWRRLQSVHAESSSKQRNRKCHLENMAIVHPLRIGKYRKHWKLNLQRSPFTCLLSYDEIGFNQHE